MAYALMLSVLPGFGLPVDTAVSAPTGTAVYAQRLQQLPTEHQALVAQRQRRLAEMSPEQREALRQRLLAWDRLDADVRTRQRRNWQAWRALPSAERAQLRAAETVYAELSSTRQQAFRDRFAGLDQLERDGWLLGPQLGRQWPRLHSLFALVPESQREPLLAVLRGLDPLALEDLARLAQRTPPEARAQLREILIGTPVENLAPWLRSQVRS